MSFPVLRAAFSKQFRLHFDILCRYSVTEQIYRRRCYFGHIVDREFQQNKQWVWGFRRLAMKMASIADAASSSTPRRHCRIKLTPRSAIDNTRRWLPSMLLHPRIQ